MTGYGKGEVSLPGRKIIAEIRSLNGKQFDLLLRLPQRYRHWEHEIRNDVARSLARGKVELSVTLESSTQCSGATINREYFEDYILQLTEIGRELELDMRTPEVTAAILRMPEVVSSDVARAPEEEHKALTDAVAKAIEEINAFRSAEGAALIADLLSRVDTIMELLGSIEPFEAARANAIRNRIREQVEAIGLTVDENRLEQEMIYYIEKIDITEEKVRLANHCDYFRAVAGGEEDAGRKLGFIAQEMGREINTLGSKANDAVIQKAVVEMKDQLERIKEQVLNIL